MRVSLPLSLKTVDLRTYWYYVLPVTCFLNSCVHIFMSIFFQSLSVAIYTIPFLTEGPEWLHDDDNVTKVKFIEMSILVFLII